MLLPFRVSLLSSIPAESFNHEILYTLVGLMFFNDNPEEYFPQTQIDVVQLPEGPGGNIIRERSFTGPVGKQARDALSYIQTNIIQGVVIKRPDRAESDRFFNYPYPAIEEALVNAVYHRSYEVREPIEVRVLPDHITITSYPGPDRSISISDLEAGTFIARRYRNRRIGEFLKELRLTEGRGTGVPKIIRAMQNNGSPQPRFVTDEERTFFTTILSAHPASNLGDGGSLTPQVTPQASNIGKNEVNILFYCIEPRSKSEITQYLGLKDDRHVRNRYVQPLIDEGLLEMTRPESPRSPNQKYRTTEVGRGVLSVISSDENSK